MFYARLLVAIVVVYLLAEVSPTAVNAFLVLLLVGLVLGRWPAFAGLANWLGRIGG